MMERDRDDLLATLPKWIAVLVVFPLLLTLLWFTWKSASDARDVKTSWPRVEAQVVDVSQADVVALEFAWQGEKVRREVKRDDSLKDVAQSQALSFYVNPADRSELRPATFAELWANTLVLGIFAVLLALIAVFLLRVGHDSMPEEFAKDLEELKQAASSPRVAGSTSAQRPRRADDGAIIEVREPREAWKANVFWGLALGLPAVLAAAFAPAEASLLEKFGLTLLGVAWIAFMGYKAVRNRAAIVRCDDKNIRLSHPFGSLSIPLAEVKSVVREDVRQAVRDFETAGMPLREKMRLMDTTPSIIKYVLYDAQGKLLLMLDEKMEPAAETRRLFQRLQDVTGQPIERA